MFSAAEFIVIPIKSVTFEALYFKIRIFSTCGILSD